MKSTLLFLLFLLFPVYCLAQGENDRLIYMDSSSAQTTKENHIYYRIIRDYNLKKKNYKIEEYYKSGKIKQEAISTEKDVYKYFGVVTTYYENGNVKEKISYKDSQPEGPYFSFYENGNKKAEGENYLDDHQKIKSRRLKINQYWDGNGDQKVFDGVGVYDEIQYKITLSGPLANGLKDGLWKGFDKRVNANFTEKYKRGEFISGTSVDKDSVEHNYTIIDEMPKPIEGIELFYSFIAKNYKTPESNKIIGKLFVGFIVGKDGYIKDVTMLRGLSHELDTEALRVINSYNKKWQNGVSRGIDVDVKYAFPINIR